MRRCTLAAVTAAILGAGVPPAASAAAHHPAKCHRTPAHVGVVTETPAGIVYATRRHVYACLFGHPAWRLPQPRDGFVFTGGGQSALPSIAGRYVGYVTTTVPDYSPAFDEVNVFDLRRGRLGRKMPARGLTAAEGTATIYDVALKRNASLAWTAAGTEGARGEGASWAEVRTAPVGATRSVLVDSAAGPTSSTEIQVDSLDLSRDRNSVTWIHGDRRRRVLLH
jgi:hypothetical protein